MKLLELLTGVKPKLSLGGAEGAEGAGLDQGQRPRMDEFKVPKLPKFSGVATSKTEPSYRVWEFEVKHLQRHYTESEVLRAVHSSVTGMAAEIMMRLGQNADVKEILTKFQTIFGTVENTEKLLADFYTAQQKSHESIAEWSCRLEEILSNQQLNDVQQKDRMLKSRFFHGLNSESIKNAIRHKFESEDYNKLLVLAREAENELIVKAGKAVAKPQIVDDPIVKKLEGIEKSLRELQSKATGWENRLAKIEGKQVQGKKVTQSK